MTITKSTVWEHAQFLNVKENGKGSYQCTRNC